MYSICRVSSSISSVTSKINKIKTLAKNRKTISKTELVQILQKSAKQKLLNKKFQTQIKST